MLSEHENTSENAGTWKKLKEIQCNRTDSINSSITAQLVHSKHLLFHLSLIFPFLANIHEFQKEAHVLRIDFLYHMTHSVLCGNNNWTTHYLQLLLNFY